MSDEQVRAESDNPNNLMIVGTIGISAIILLAIVIAVTQWFGFATRGEVALKQLAPESTQLRTLRATEQASLNRYQWVDKAAGTVRIPLEQATALTLRDWAARPSGTVAPAEHAAPVPVEPAAPGKK